MKLTYDKKTGKVKIPKGWKRLRRTATIKSGDHVDCADNWMLCISSVGKTVKEAWTVDDIVIHRVTKP